MMDLSNLTAAQKLELMRELSKSSDVQELRKIARDAEETRREAENAKREETNGIILNMANNVVAGLYGVNFPKDAETLAISVVNGEITEFTMSGTFVEKAKVYGRIAAMIERIVKENFPAVDKVISKRVTAIEFEIALKGRVHMVDLNFRGARRFSLKKYREEQSTGKTSVQGDNRPEMSNYIPLPELARPKVVGTMAV